MLGHVPLVSPCLFAGGRLWGLGWQGLGRWERNGTGGGGCPGSRVCSPRNRFIQTAFPGSGVPWVWGGWQVGISGGDDAESAVVLERGSHAGGGVCGGRGMQQCADCGGAGLLFSEQAGGAAGAPAERGSGSARSAGGRSAWGAFASACGFESAAKELKAAQSGRSVGVMGEVYRGKRRKRGGIFDSGGERRRSVRDGVVSGVGSRGR